MTRTIENILLGTTKEPAADLYEIMDAAHWQGVLRAGFLGRGVSVA